MPFDLSHVLNWRFTVFRPSSRPQAIHTRRSRDADLAVRSGKFKSKSASCMGCVPRPPRAPPLGGLALVGLARGHITNAPLNDPMYAKRSVLWRPTYSDSAPPMESPAMA